MFPCKPDEKLVVIGFNRALTEWPLGMLHLLLSQEDISRMFREDFGEIKSMLIGEDAPPARKGMSVPLP